jgi:DNA-binding transcriptional ArsR family regulator
MQRAIPSLAPILRSDVQGRILAELLIDPSRELSAADLARSIGASPSTVSREIDRAELAGIVTTRRVGNLRLVRADTDNPLLTPMRQLVLATYGAPAVIAEEFGDLRGIEQLYLFGSWAARYSGELGPAPRDIDVLVIGRVDREQVYEAAERAEPRLTLGVQVTFRTPQQWAEEKDPFIAEVKSRPLIQVLTLGHDAR